MCSVLYCFQISITLEFSLHILKHNEISNFLRIPSVGAEFFHANGPTYWHDDANRRFSQFCEGASKRVDHPSRIIDDTKITVTWKQFFCQCDFQSYIACTPRCTNNPAQGRCGNYFFFCWHIIFVGTGYGNWFMLPFWSPEFWGGCTRFRGNFLHPWCRELHPQY
jgi:hypothetical protein